MLGDLSRLAPNAASAAEQLVALTADNSRLTLNLFISYGSRAELVRAAKLIARDVRDGRLDLEAVDEEALRSRLYTSDCPDPDLLIRTSGEQRISNFLLWQCAYAELYMSPVLWPDFSRRHLYEAIMAYQNRDRRFGRVSA